MPVVPEDARAVLAELVCAVANSDDDGRALRAIEVPVVPGDDQYKRI